MCKNPKFFLYEEASQSNEIGKMNIYRLAYA